MSYTQHVSISTQSNKKINDLGACKSGARSLIAIYAECMTQPATHMKRLALSWPG